VNTSIRLGMTITAAGLIALCGIGFAPTAGATHDGETITVSKFSGLSDGEVVQVTFGGMTPASAGGKPVKVVIAGQKEFTTVPDKLNFAEYGAATPIPVAEDGTGSTAFTATIDHGTDNTGAPFVCGPTTPCYIVAIQEPFLPLPRWSVQEVTFGTAPAPGPAPTEAATTAAPTTTAPTTAVPTTTEAVVAVAEEPSKVEEEESSNTGIIIGAVAAGVVLLGGLGFVLARRGKDEDGAPPAPLV